MDNFLIFILIACAILWWDSKKRNKAIEQIWDDVGIKEGMYVTVTVERTMTEEDYRTTLYELLDDQDDTPEKLVHELVNDILKVMPAEEMTDAKSALKSLGYKNTDIKKAVDEVLNNMGTNMKSGEIVTSALRILNA